MRDARQRLACRRLRAFEHRRRRRPSDWYSSLSGRGPTLRALRAATSHQRLARWKTANGHQCVHARPRLHPAAGPSRPVRARDLRPSARAGPVPSLHCSAEVLASTTISAAVTATGGAGTRATTEASTDSPSPPPTRDWKSKAQLSRSSSSRPRRRRYRSGAIRHSSDGKAAVAGRDARDLRLQPASSRKLAQRQRLAAKSKPKGNHGHSEPGAGGPEAVARWRSLSVIPMPCFQASPEKARKSWNCRRRS